MFGDASHKMMSRINTRLQQSCLSPTPVCPRCTNAPDNNLPMQAQLQAPSITTHAPTEVQTEAQETVGDTQIPGLQPSIAVKSERHGAAPPYALFMVADLSHETNVSFWGPSTGVIPHTDVQQCHWQRCAAHAIWRQTRQQCRCFSSQCRSCVTAIQSHALGDSG